MYDRSPSSRYETCCCDKKAANIDASIHGAIDKLKRSLEHLYEKKEHHRGGLPEYVDVDDDVKLMMKRKDKREKKSSFGLFFVYQIYT